MVALWGVLEGQQCRHPIPKDLPLPRIIAELERWMESWSTQQKGQFQLTVNLLFPKTAGMSTRCPMPWEVARFPSKEGHPRVCESWQLVLGSGKRYQMGNLKLLEEWRSVAEEQPHCGGSFRMGMPLQQNDLGWLGGP